MERTTRTLPEGITPFHKMEAAVRLAARSSDAGTFIPYHREIDDKPQLVYLRKKMKTAGFPLFAIDVGQVGEDRTRFGSLAYLDFRIESYTNGSERQSIAYVSKAHPALTWKDETEETMPVFRSAHEVETYGLFVHWKHRQENMGKSLVSMSRVLIAALGVNEVIFSDISTADPARMQFYRSTGADISVVETEFDRYTKSLKTTSVQAVLSTHPTPKQPYVFG